MRLVALLPHYPWPPLGGARTRSWHLTSILARAHETHLFVLQTPDESPGDTAAPHPFASVDTVTVPTSNPPRWSAAWTTLRLRSLRHPAAAWFQPYAVRRFRALLERLRPDAIVYGMSWTLPYAAFAGHIPGVADEHNYDPQITARTGAGNRGFDAVKWKLYAAATVRAERRNLRAVRGIAACSPEDAAIFRREAPHADVELVPNGVATDDFVPTRPGDDVVMAGSFSYTPNVEGARWLAREVWPMVLRAVPDARLRLVGLRSETTLADLAGLPGVVVVGTVPDMRPELTRARLAVAPLRVGGGTRIKILEAFASGRAVVSTTVGAEGIDARDGACLLLRDDAEGFAEAIVALLTDRERARAMGARGRALAVARYDWRDSAARFEALLSRVAR